MKIKYTSIIYLVALAFSCMTFQSCLQDECKGSQTYVQYEPVWKTAEEFRVNEINVLAPQELEEPGNIYFYQNFILINERTKGIHIIDNNDVENPVNLAFIEIPGNGNMAVKGNILYADNYVDLLSIDITDIQNANLVKRVEDVFQPLSYNDEQGYFLYYEETEITQEVHCSDHRYGSNFFSGKSNRNSDVMWGLQSSPAGIAEASFDQNSSNSSAAPQGIGGSMARFTLAHDHLYVIDESNLHVLNLDDITCPELVNEINVGWGIETIYPYEDNLFIGANDGMHIFSATNPANPVHRSTFQHARACDPVVVNGDIAYVTLRGGTPCQNFNNQLDVLDVSDIENPQLLQTYQMDNPHGMSIKGNTLFLCDGASGLKVYDVSDVDKIDENELDRKKNFFAYDAIALGNDVVMVIGEDGFYQFDASNPNNLKKLSVISVHE